MKRQTGSAPAGINLFGKTPSLSDDGPCAETGDSASDTQLKRIDDALRRLDTGRFGHCLYCGDQIGLGRLTADPAVSSCVVCDED